MKHLKKLISTALALIVIACSCLLGISVSAAATITPTDLKTENLENPLGITVDSPRFSWKITSGQRSALQIAYRIIVSDGFSTVWDSGKTESDKTNGIVYAGDALEYRKHYTWKVKVWDQDNHESDWSDTASFETELSENDWNNSKWIRKTASTELNLTNAEWIWPTNGAEAETVFFRAELTKPSEKSLRLATAVFSADDKATVYLNGTKIGDSNNNWASAKSLDITQYIQSGKNTFAVEAVNTSSGVGGFIAKITLHYTDGSKQVLTTNSTNWRYSKSPASGWTASDFDASDWASPAQSIPYGQGEWGSSVSIGSLDNQIADPAPYLRKEFSTNGKKIRSARAYITGLGHYELFLNGDKVGDNVIDPLVTEYKSHYFYVSYDVTDMLNSGTNAIGVALGRGYYAILDTNQTGSQTTFWASMSDDIYPKLRMKLCIEFTDSSKMEVVTDNSWKTHDSPTLLDEAYYGELYDARLELDGWNNVGFDDSSWESAVSAKSPEGTVESQTANANKIVKTLNPVSVNKISDDTYIFDMGRIITGSVRLTTSGQAGDTVNIRYAEKLNQDGTINRDNFLGDWSVNGTVRQAQCDTYILKGTSSESWASCFTYKCFRYVEISGCSVAPTLNDVVGLVINADVESTGEFSCSNDLFNQIHQVCRNALLINLHSYPSDTPLYENLGYLGDGYVIQEMGMYNFDLASFYEKWADDIRIDSGYRWSDIAPGGGSGDVSPEWQGAICFVPWQAYLFTGDTTLLRENYTAMKKVFAAMRAEMSDNTITSYWGDHIAQNSNIPCISGTAHVYYMAYILSQAAKLVGYPNESATYAAEAQTIKDAFNAKFYNTSLGYYCEPDSLKFYQGAQALPIAFGMVPDEYLANLCTKLGTLSTSYETGIYSTKHIFNILTQSGYGDVAYNMVNTTSYPGWGNIISQGATALWERWEQSTRSRSHQMFGTIDEWFYRSIIGINSDGAGFSKITIKPYAVGDLTWASGSTETVRGKISSSWTKAADDTFTLNVTIPANTTATVYVPAANAADVTESGISAANAEGVELLRSENGFAVFSVGSGSYSFKSVYTAPTVDSTEYKITVTDGKASVGAGNEISTAIAGTSVTLTADTAPAGKMFEKWEIISGNVTLTSPNQNPTEFIMPNADVEIKAIYQDISASHTHDYKNLKYNRDNCWLECDCGVKQNESPHTDNDGDGTCDICGLPIPSTATQSPLTGHFAKTLPWIFALSVLSLSGGIASLCVTLRKRRA